uniref:Uncharacterized protein n=1 Tax=Rhizophora mucronata TaxID=61149 RepID=A0A2P2PHU1_RHIMU
MSRKPGIVGETYIVGLIFR